MSRIGVALISLATVVSTLAAVPSAAAPALATGYHSFALVGSGTTSFDVVGGVRHGLLQPSTTDNVSATELLGTAISADGDTGLFALGRAQVGAIRGYSTGNLDANGIDLSAFVHEGHDDFGVFSRGVAAGNGFGLVGVGEQGVVQLRQGPSGAWQVDKRVVSAGTNEAGDPHKPGFIRFPSAPSTQLTFDGVVVSPQPLANGKYLGLAIDRADQTIDVIEGVGTAHPKVTGEVTSPELSYSASGDYGNGGMSFSPAAATRAVVTTVAGLDVLDLTDPTHPALLGQTVATLPNVSEGVTVAPDGNHVVMTAGEKVDLFKGLLHATGPLKFVTAVTPDTSAPFDIYAAQFVSDGTLIVNRSGYLPSTTTTAYFLTAINNLLSGSSPSVGTSIQLGGAPDQGNSLSVFPAFAPVRIGPTSPHDAKVGKHYHLTLVAHGGVGHYTFAITHGRLPTGLSLHHKTISGKPQHKGKKTVTIRALNEYGGAAFRSVIIRVK